MPLSSKPLITYEDPIYPRVGVNKPYGRRAY